jgi:hypothetical protein
VFGGRSPQAALATTTFDDLEPLGVDVRPVTGHMRGPLTLPRCVWQRRLAPRAEALVHPGPLPLHVD